MFTADVRVQVPPRAPERNDNLERGCRFLFSYLFTFHYSLFSFLSKRLSFPDKSLSFLAEEIKRVLPFLFSGCGMAVLSKESGGGVSPPAGG